MKKIILLFMMICLSGCSGKVLKRDVAGSLIANGGIGFDYGDKLNFVDYEFKPELNYIKYQSSDEAMLSIINALKKKHIMGYYLEEFYNIFKNNKNSEHIKWISTERELQFIPTNLVFETPEGSKARTVVARDIYSDANGDVVELNYNSKLLDRISKVQEDQLSWLLVHEFLWFFTQNPKDVLRVNANLHSDKINKNDLLNIFLDVSLYAPYTNNFFNVGATIGKSSNYTIIFNSFAKQGVVVITDLSGIIKATLKLEDFNNFDRKTNFFTNSKGELEFFYDQFKISKLSEIKTLRKFVEESTLHVSNGEQTYLSDTGEIFKISKNRHDVIVVQLKKFGEKFYADPTATDEHREVCILENNQLICIAAIINLENIPVSSFYSQTFFASTENNRRAVIVAAKEDDRLVQVYDFDSFCALYFSVTKNCMKDDKIICTGVDFAQNKFSGDSYTIEKFNLNEQCKKNNISGSSPLLFYKMNEKSAYRNQEFK